jgi:hypothetical protein
VYWFYDYDPSKVYNLYGETDLIYQRQWTTGNKAADSVFDGIVLGLKGYIIDRKLATFDVSGSFSQDFEQGSSSISTYTLHAETSLLNEQVRRGVLSYFPQPIRLSFDYGKEGNGTSQAYGVGLGYSRPGVIRFFQNGKIISYDGTGWSLQQQAQMQNSTNQNGGNGGAAGANPFYLLFPRLTLDYDRGTSSGVAESLTTDHVDFRAETHSPHGDYYFDYLYNHNEYNGNTTEFTYKHLEFDANFKYAGEKTSRFESWNTLLIDDVEPINTLDARSSNVWTKSLGPDLKDSIALAAGYPSITSPPTELTRNRSRTAFVIQSSPKPHTTKTVAMPKMLATTLSIGFLRQLSLQDRAPSGTRPPVLYTAAVFPSRFWAKGL